MVWLAVLIVLGQSVIVTLLFGAIKTLGDYTESNMLLHKQTMEALAEIARIRRADAEAIRQKPPLVS